MRIMPLAPIHAADAARLHIAGQPGTFLTSLGPGVLTAIYRSLPRLPSGYGYAALPEAGDSLDGEGRIAGFISATTGTGRLFAEMLTRRAGTLLPPLLAQMARRPVLLWRSVETLTYPLRTYEPNAGATGASTAGASAELLSIMVEPALRSQGIGARLLDALVDECRARRIAHLDVTVDATNEGAQRFYRRQGFALTHRFTLYRREMVSLRRDVSAHGAVK